MYFAGDVVLANHFEEEVGDSLSTPFAKLRWFGESDITMVNLENPITTRGEVTPKEFNFRQHPKYTSMVRNAGIDIVTLGNNHIYDFGDAGVFDTIHDLDSLGIGHVGAGMNITEARKPVIREIRGMRIAFLGYLGFVKTSYLPSASATEAGPAIFTIANLKQDIAGLRGHADYIVVNIHWGVEKSHEPEERQIALAHAAIRAGADLIIGHHPHVLQGIERYRGKIIAYSLGNFIFGGKAINSYPTAVLKIELPSRRPARAQAAVIPVDIERWQASALQGAKADSVLREVRSYSEIFRETIFRKR